MAGKTATKNNKNLIIGICAAIAAIIIIIVIVVVIMLNNNGSIPLGGINDSYFESDDTKYVLNLDGDSIYVEQEEFVPTQAHYVYHYSNNEVTGLDVYYEYDSDSMAESSYKYYKSNNLDNTYQEIKQSGKYVILTASPIEYKGLTPENIKEQIEFVKLMENSNNDTLDGTDGETVVQDE